MVTRARLGLYLKNEEIKKQIKVAAAKRGMTATDYCARAIEERLVRDGERGTNNEAQDKLAFLSGMDRLRREMGPIGMPTAELVEEGRRK